MCTCVDIGIDTHTFIFTYTDVMIYRETDRCIGVHIERYIEIDIDMSIIV